MYSKIKPHLSTIAIAIVIVACLLIDLHIKNFEKQQRVIEGDIHSYYAYLPAVFIYNDIKLVKSDYCWGRNYQLFWPSTTEEGKKVIKTSMGMAILYSPFFFVGHTLAYFSDYPQNGFSVPYKFLLLMSALFYLFIGLDYLRKILLHYKFCELHIAITLLMIGLGTNLLCYSSQSGTMSHVYSFCLFSVFTYYTIQWYKNSSFKNTVIIGLLIGLISLVRPTNSIIIIIFIFYGINSLNAVKERFLFYIRNMRLVVLMGSLALLVWVPQLIYWKVVTGHFFYYSYIGERFFFDSPKILDGLFSFRKGWLLYTPMMIFALVGIFVLRDIAGKLKLPILLFIVINIYMLFSWWCWWYGGSLGQRSMVDCYALLAIPFASFVQFVSQKKWYYQGTFYGIAVFFVFLNVVQTYQFQNVALHYDGMTSTLYFKQFGKLGRIEDFESYVDRPDYEEALKGRRNSSLTRAKGSVDPVQMSEINVPNPIYNYYSNTEEKNRKQIYLKAFNNKYVCADGNLNAQVIANKDKASIRERFSLVMFEQNKCALLSFTNNFLCTDLGSRTELTNSRRKVAWWETFTLIELENGDVALKAANGKYVSVDESTFELLANSENIGRRERFRLIAVAQ